MTRPRIRSNYRKGTFADKPPPEPKEGQRIAEVPHSSGHSGVVSLHYVSLPMEPWEGEIDGQ